MEYPHTCSSLISSLRRWTGKSRTSSISASTFLKLAWGRWTSVLDLLVKSLVRGLLPLILVDSEPGASGMVIILWTRRRDVTRPAESERSGLGDSFLTFAKGLSGGDWTGTRGGRSSSESWKNPGSWIYSTSKIAPYRSLAVEPTRASINKFVLICRGSFLKRECAASFLVSRRKLPSAK